MLEKIEACTARIGVTQARIDACKAKRLDASVDEKWLATELDLLSILIDVLKTLKLARDRHDRPADRLKSSARDRSVA